MQTRLVAPNFSSLNSYESFLLITPTTLFQFNGKHASVLKKSKGTELVTAITMAKEFKCAADKVRTGFYFSEFKYMADKVRTGFLFSELIMADCVGRT